MRADVAGALRAHSLHVAHEATTMEALWRTPLDALDTPTRRARAEGMRAVARALDARDPARAEAAMRAVFEASRDAALAELPRAAPALFASAPQRGSAGR